MIGLTGGKGFIGQAVVDELTSRGMGVKLLDLPLHDVCLLSAADLDGCEGVIHLAGILGTTETIGDDTKLIDVNVLGALNVANAARILGIPMVQIGTGHKGRPNVYAITKGCAEDLLLARAQWSGQPVTVVRAYHAYGKGQKAPMPYGKATVTKIVPNFVCRALAGDPLPVHGDGEQLVDLVHVSDVARSLVDAIHGPYGEVVEAGTGIATSVLEAAQDVIAFTESTSRIIHVEMPPGFVAGDAVVARRPAPHYVDWPAGLGLTVPYYAWAMAR